MKRVRTEHVQMAVSCYLKRRQYVDSDGPLKQGLRLSQTAEEMAANLTGDHVGLDRAGSLLVVRGVPTFTEQRAGFPVVLFPASWLDCTSFHQSF